MIFKAYYKSIHAKESVIPSVAFVKGTDAQDAKRIMEENLDTTKYFVQEVTEAAEHMVTPQSITINFQNKSCYHFG